MAGYGITYNVPEDAPNVSFFTVDPQNAGNSGDSMTIVGNIYFSWSSAESGFTNTGWWGTDFKEGPTAQSEFGFTDDTDVIAYLQAGNNLDNVFAAWQRYIDSLPIYEQYLVVGNFAETLADDHSGAACMTNA